MALRGLGGLKGISGLIKLSPAGISYLLRDLFTVDQAAPLTSPRTSTPGPGTLIIVDTFETMSISGGEMVPNASTALQGDPSMLWDSQSRVAGLTFYAQIKDFTTLGGSNAARVVFGWSVNTTPSTLLMYGGRLQPSSLVGAVNNAVATSSGVGTFTDDAYATYRVILRPTGYFLLQGTELLWVSDLGSEASLYPVIAAAGSDVYPFAVKDLGVYINTIWANESGIYISRAATTSAGQTATMSADGQINHTIVAATGVTQEFRFRWVDDNNCWIVRMNQGAGTVQLIEKVAGVETVRASGSQTWTNGTSYRISVKCTGTTLRVYVGQILKATYASASFQQTATGMKVSHAGTVLDSWPRDAAAYL